MSTLSALILWFGSLVGGPAVAHQDCPTAWPAVDSVCDLQRSASEDDEDGEADAREPRERPEQARAFTISNGF